MPLSNGTQVNLVGEHDYNYVYEKRNAKDEKKIKSNTQRNS